MGIGGEGVRIVGEREIEDRGDWKGKEDSLNTIFQEM